MTLLSIFDKFKWIRILCTSFQEEEIIFKIRTQLLVFVAVAIFCQSGVAEDAVTLSQIKGFDPETGGIMTNKPIKFYLNYEVGDERITAFANPYRVHSPDGASWQPISIEVVAPISTWFSADFNVIEFSVTGEGADTLDFYAVDFSFPTVGFAPGYNDEVAYVATMITDDQIGKTICIDTAQTINTPFIWVNENAEPVFPTWVGEQCFEIVDCCTGHRGDVDSDGLGPNIVDAARIVDKIFRGAYVPICDLEADVNNDGNPADILDLNFIINYIHRNGTLPDQCPPN